MKALLSICLFGGLLSPGSIQRVSSLPTGAPMSCYHCFGEDCARPEIQKCEAHKDACASVVVETTLVNSLMSKYRVTAMQCSPASFCSNNYGSISTLDGGSIRSNVQCCYTDLCNNMTASLPEPEDLISNGVQCPASFDINSTECQEVKNISCTGGETKCIEIAAQLSIDFFGEEVDLCIQGCATPNLCFVPPLDAESAADKVKLIYTKRKCSQGDEDLMV